VKLRTSIILAGAAVAALAVSGTAGASVSRPAASRPGSIIRPTGVKPGAIKSINSSSPAGSLGLKTTSTYAGGSTLTSDNWSGYTTPQDAGAYNSTATTFTVPSGTTCGSNTTMAAFWAGLDGWGDNTVEQDGITAECISGSLSMYAWIETYPAPSEEIVYTATGDPVPVEPGDTIVSEVTEISPAEYDLYLDDETQGWYFSGDVDMPSGYTGEDMTAEVITEAPALCTSTSCTVQTLADFGSVSYTSSIYGTPSAGTDWYSSANTDQIDLYQNGVEADGVGALGTDGAFTITYGTPPSPPPTDKVTVTSPGNQSTTAGVKASLQIHATSSLGEALSYAAVGLPPGLSINSSTGLITGTPTDTGTYSVAVAASDPGGHTGSASFTWTIKKLAAPKPRLCGRSGTVIHVCWPAVPDATRYYGLLAGHGHNFSTAALHETFRGLKRHHSYKLEMHASDTASASATVVLTVRTK
jgi:Peptidase A4 family/Putative Ig domain